MRAVWIWAVLVLGNFLLLLLSPATKAATVSGSNSQRRRVENLSFDLLRRPINVKWNDNYKETEIERSAISNRHVRRRIVKRSANRSEPSETPTTICRPENSCSGRCTNSTDWKTQLKFTCSCDPDCYEVFNDCCADYEKYCGPQNPKSVPTKKFNWTCEESGNYEKRTWSMCTIGDGIWMVSQCADKWPNDDTRTKCETPFKTLTLSSSDLYRFLPVVSPENVTFRNVYCGLCNYKIKGPYESWPVDIQTTIMPPKSYSLEEKIRFLVSHGAEFMTSSDGPLSPKVSQARRYCIKQIKSSCRKPSPSCINGPTAVVSATSGYMTSNYRNINCALCSGEPAQSISCFPNANSASGHCMGGSSSGPFLLALDYQRNEKGEEKMKWSVKGEPCGVHAMIYDDVLEICRVNWFHPPDQDRHERFYVIAWLVPQHVSNNYFCRSDFQKSLAKYFDVSDTQIVNISISFQRMPFSPLNSFYMISSTITLTPEQSLELLSVNRDTHNTSKASLLNFIYFKEPLSMVIINNMNYTIVKTTSRPLACAGKTVYTPMEYTILHQDKVYIDSTNTTYERSEYFMESSPQSNTTLGNITVCKKYNPIKLKVINKAVCNGMVKIMVGAGLLVSSFLFNF